MNDEHRIRHENECEKILEQRHQIKAKPIAMTDWEYNKKSGKFYVYGNDRRVIFLNIRQIIIYIVLYYEHKECLV